MTGKERVIERHTGGETRGKGRQTGGIVEGNVDREAEDRQAGGRYNGRKGGEAREADGRKTRKRE